MKTSLNLFFVLIFSTFSLSQTKASDDIEFNLFNDVNFPFSNSCPSNDGFKTTSQNKYYLDIMRKNPEIKDLVQRDINDVFRRLKNIYDAYEKEEIEKHMMGHGSYMDESYDILFPRYGKPSTENGFVGTSVAGRFPFNNPGQRKNVRPFGNPNEYFSGTDRASNHYTKTYPYSIRDEISICSNSSITHPLSPYDLYKKIKTDNPQKKITFSQIEDIYLKHKGLYGDNSYSEKALKKLKEVFENPKLRSSTAFVRLKIFSKNLKKFRRSCRESLKETFPGINYPSDYDEKTLNKKLKKTFKEISIDSDRRLSDLFQRFGFMELEKNKKLFKGSKKTFEEMWMAITTPPKKEKIRDICAEIIHKIRDHYNRIELNIMDPKNECFDQEENCDCKIEDIKTLIATGEISNAFSNIMDFVNIVKENTCIDISSLSVSCEEEKKASSTPPLTQKKKKRKKPRNKSKENQGKVKVGLVAKSTGSGTIKRTGSGTIKGTGNVKVKNKPRKRRGSPGRSKIEIRIKKIVENELDKAKKKLEKGHTLTGNETISEICQHSDKNIKGRLVAKHLRNWKDSNFPNGTLKKRLQSMGEKRFCILLKHYEPHDVIPVLKKHNIANSQEQIVDFITGCQGAGVCGKPRFNPEKGGGRSLQQNIRNQWCPQVSKEKRVFDLNYRTKPGSLFLDRSLTLWGWGAVDLGFHETFIFDPELLHGCRDLIRSGQEKNCCKLANFMCIQSGRTFRNYEDYKNNLNIVFRTPQFKNLYKSCADQAYSLSKVDHLNNFLHAYVPSDISTFSEATGDLTAGVIGKVLKGGSGGNKLIGKILDNGGEAAIAVIIETAVEIRSKLRLIHVNKCKTRACRVLRTPEEIKKEIEERKKEIINGSFETLKGNIKQKICSKIADQISEKTKADKDKLKESCEGWANRAIEKIKDFLEK